MPSATIAICPPVSARSSSCWATRPDSVDEPAPKSVDSTENAELPMAAVMTSSTIHDDDDGAAAPHHEAREPVHRATAEPSEVVSDGGGRATLRGRRRRRAARRRARSRPGRPTSRTIACWRSASTITCDVISQPSAHSAGVAERPQRTIERAHRNRQRLGDADAGAADRAHHDEARRVGVEADRAGAETEPDAEPDGGRADPGGRRARSIPPMVDLREAEHGAGDEAADDRRAGGVDVADGRSGRHAAEREPDEGGRPIVPTA